MIGIKNSSMNKKHNTKKKIIIMSVVLLSLLLVGLLVGADYLNYKNGNRSQFFGTLDVYSKGQTAKFDNLDLKVESVLLKKYPAPTIKPSSPTTKDCSGLSKESASGGLINSPFGICTTALIDYESGLRTYNDKLSHSESKNELTVTFQYLNVYEKPINLSDYEIKIIANTTLVKYEEPISKCNGMSGSAFLKGHPTTECISVDIDKNYNGPLVLSIKKAGKEKIINLELSDIVRN